MTGRHTDKTAADNDGVVFGPEDRAGARSEPEPEVRRQPPRSFCRRRRHLTSASAKSIVIMILYAVYVIIVYYYRNRGTTRGRRGRASVKW